LYDINRVTQYKELFFPFEILKFDRKQLTNTY